VLVEHVVDGFIALPLTLPSGLLGVPCRVVVAGIATARAAIAPSPSVGSFDVDLITDFPRHPGVREENEEINRVLSDVFIGRFVHDLRDGNLVLIALCADVFFWIP
jgi:hypothetical protein